MEWLVAWKSEESICFQIKFIVSLPKKHGCSKNVGMQESNTSTALLWKSRYLVHQIHIGRVLVCGACTRWIWDVYGFGTPFSFFILFDVLDA